MIIYLIPIEITPSSWIVTFDRSAFSPGTLVASTNKTGRHDRTQILLNVALNTITLTPFEYLDIASTFLGLVP